MTDKTLKIGTKLDPKGLNEMERALKDLEKMGIKVSKTFQGIRMGTPQGGAQMAKQITNMGKDLQKLNGITADTAKTMEWSLGRQIEKDTKRLDKFTSKVDQLNKKFQESKRAVEIARKAGFDPSDVRELEKRQDRAAGRVGAAEVRRGAAQQGLNELQAGKAGRDWGAIGTRGGSIFAAVAQGLNMVSGAAGMYQGFKNKEVKNQAAVRGYETGLVSELLGGDYKSLYYAGKNAGTNKGSYKSNFSARDLDPNIAGPGAASMNRAADAAARKEFDKRSKTTNVENAKEVGGGIAAALIKYGASAGAGAANLIGGTLMGAAAIATSPLLATGIGAAVPLALGAGAVGMLASGGQQAYGAYQSLSKNDARVDEMKSFAENMEAKKKRDPIETATLDYIQSTAESRYRANMAIQGYGNSAWGQSGTRSFDESAGFAAQLIRGNGLNLGKGGSGTINAMKSLFGMEAQGIDRGAAAGMFTNIAQSRGGDAAKASAELEKILAKSFRAGLKDARLGEEIGTVVANRSYGRLGAIGTDAMTDYMTAGGAPKTLREIQARAAGGDAFDQNIQNNPAFMMQRQSSIKAMFEKKGMALDWPTLNALTKASKDDLLAGDSPVLSQMGVSASMQKELLKKDINSSFSNTGLNQLSRNAKGYGKFVGMMQDNGGDLDKVLRRKGMGTKEFDQLIQQGSLAYSQGTNIFKDQMEAEHFLRGIYGSPGKGGNGTYAKHGDGRLAAAGQKTQRFLDKEANANNEPVNGVGIGDEGYGVLATNKKEKLIKAAGKTEDVLNAVKDGTKTEDAMLAFDTFLTKFIEIMNKHGMGNGPTMPASATED